MEEAESDELEEAEADSLAALEAEEVGSALVEDEEEGAGVAELLDSVEDEPDADSVDDADADDVSVGVAGALVSAAAALKSALKASPSAESGAFMASEMMPSKDSRLGSVALAVTVPLSVLPAASPSVALGMAPSGKGSRSGGPTSAMADATASGCWGLLGTRCEHKVTVETI